MTAHAAWRVLVMGSQNGVNLFALSEMEIRATPGGADQTSGGTPIASSEFGGLPASNAFDNNSATLFASGAVGFPAWLGYQKSMEAREFVLTARNDASYDQGPAGPIAFQWSDTPTDQFSWVTAWTATPVAWTTGSSQTFTEPSAWDDRANVATVGVDLIDGMPSNRAAVAAIGIDIVSGASENKVSVADMGVDIVIGPPVTAAWVAAIGIDVVVTGSPATDFFPVGPQIF